MTKAVYKKLRERIKDVMTTDKDSEWTKTENQEYCFGLILGYLECKRITDDEYWKLNHYIDR